LIAVAGSGFYTLFFPNVLLKEPRFSASVVEISIIIATYNLATGVMQPVIASVGSRNPPKWIAGCLAGTGLCYLLILLTQSASQVEVVTIALGVVYSAITPLTLSLLTTFVPRGYWGRTIGLYGAAEDVGILVGSSLASFVWGIWGAQYSIAMMGLIYLFVSAICFLSYRSGKLGQRSRSLDSLTD